MTLRQRTAKTGGQLWLVVGRTLSGVTEREATQAHAQLTVDG